MSKMQDQSNSSTRSRQYKSTISTNLTTVLGVLRPRKLESNVGSIVSLTLAGFDWVEHGFGTRDAISSQEDMASLTQIHSATVLPAVRIGRVGEGDGLVTSNPGVAVSVRTADCFPVLLVDGRLRVVAAVHAGWRGTAARIVPAAIGLMSQEFETRPEDIYAAIGPGIGKCCYRVGEDVGRRFGLEGAGHVDLGEANRDQLIEAGVPEAHIDRLNLCTFCDARFHSYRRDKNAAGRMISFIGIRPNGLTT
jgi:YfiH family protein